ncbi:MAG: hypothetical protein HUJ13_00225, partial [Hydrogenovibrio crunogenus]|nr:hypothetical protein [Hydrogenovibrio crunogenus]
MAFNLFSTRKKNLNQTMLTGALITALAIFSITMFAASQIFIESLSTQSEKNATTLSQLSFDNMYQIMSKGWSREQLLDFRQDLKRTYKEQNLEFSMYRADIVNQQFGFLASDVNDDMRPLFQEVLLSKEKKVIEKINHIRIL